MDTAFLNRLAKVLKKGKSAACQRAIERLLTAVQKRYEYGEFATSYFKTLRKTIMKQAI
jgi:hypothetical protein